MNENGRKACTARDYTSIVLTGFDLITLGGPATMPLKTVVSGIDEDTASTEGPALYETARYGSYMDPLALPKLGTIGDSPNTSEDLCGESPGTFKHVGVN